MEVIQNFSSATQEAQLAIAFLLLEGCQCVADAVLSVEKHIGNFMALQCFEIMFCSVWYLLLEF